MTHDLLDELLSRDDLGADDSIGEHRSIDDEVARHRPGQFCARAANDAPRVTTFRVPASRRIH